MKEKLIILFSLIVPAEFAVTVEIRGILEHYFRYSEKYHFIYSYGSIIFFFLQAILILASFYIGLYVIVNRKELKLKTKIISLLTGPAVFLYLTIVIAYAIISQVFFGRP